MFCLHEGLWGSQVPWNWSYRPLWAAMWAPGVEPGSSGRTARVLNCWAISSAPLLISIFQQWHHFLLRLYQQSCSCDPEEPKRVIPTHRHLRHSSDFVTECIRPRGPWVWWVTDSTRASYLPQKSTAIHVETPCCNSCTCMQFSCQ